MATKLFLRSTQTNPIGGIYFDMVIAAGAGSTTVVVDTDGSTEKQWTQTSGGSLIQWVSGRAPSGGFTLTTSDISIWAHESATAGNAGGRYRLFKRTLAGVETELLAGPFDDGVEFTKTTPTEMLWPGNPTDTVFVEDDRILLKLYITNVGTMGTGQTCTLTYNEADAGTGDSFLNIAETISFKAEAVDVNVSVTGVATTSSVGTVTISGDAPVTVTGVGGTVSVGDVSIGIGLDVPVTGMALASSVGNTVITGSANTVPSGISSALSLGDVVVSGEANTTFSGIGMAMLLGSLDISGGAGVTSGAFGLALALGTVTVTTEGGPPPAPQVLGASQLSHLNRLSRL